MNAMIDVSCPKCGRKFGWAGSFASRPACPKCGHRPPQDELEAIDRRWEADEQRRRTDPMAASGAVLRQQRVDAGLTLRQAAKVMRVDAVWLSAVEQGQKPLPESLAERMREAYGLEAAPETPREGE